MIGSWLSDYEVCKNKFNDYASLNQQGQIERLKRRSMKYEHKYSDGSSCPFPPGKVVCVGRNFFEHIKELNNPVPDEPILFMKPSTSLRALEDGIELPEYSQNCHNETELAVLFGKELRKADAGAIEEAIDSYAIALDLTLRDIQQKLKDKGYPWEVAKAFDGACPISPFIKKEGIADPQDTMLKLTVNGEIRQQESTKLMITKILDLIVYASHRFTFMPGDIFLTGTPAGVAQLKSGDQLELELESKYVFQTFVK